jgi:hypothetical protein
METQTKPETPGGGGGHGGGGGGGDGTATTTTSTSTDATGPGGGHGGGGGGGGGGGTATTTTSTSTDTEGLNALDAGIERATTSTSTTTTTTTSTTTTSTSTTATTDADPITPEAPAPSSQGGLEYFTPDGDDRHLATERVSAEDLHKGVKMKNKEEFNSTINETEIRTTNFHEVTKKNPDAIVDAARRELNSGIALANRAGVTSLEIIGKSQEYSAYIAAYNEMKDPSNPIDLSYQHEEAKPTRDQINKAKAHINAVMEKSNDTNPELERHMDTNKKIKTNTLNSLDREAISGVLKRFRR